MSDEEELGEEIEGEGEIPRVDLDFEELDESGLFRKIDLRILNDLRDEMDPVIRKKKRDEEKRRRKEEGDDEEDEDSEDEEDGEDEEFVFEDFLEKYNPFNIKNEEELEEWGNRVKYVHKFGIYGGDRNMDTNEREGSGHAIFSNKDEYIGSYLEGLKSGANGVYIWKSIVNEEEASLFQLFKDQAPRKVKDLLLQEPPNYELASTLFVQDIMKKRELERQHRSLEEDEYDDEPSSSSSNNNNNNNNDDKDLNLINVRLMLEYGPHPVYIGDFKKDKRDGIGVFKYQNLGRYKGSWFEGERDGIGSMYYPNGDLYEGEWKEGKKHGKGKYYFRSATTNPFGRSKGVVYYEGTFEHGEMKQGKWVRSDGVYYEGEFQKDEKGDVPQGKGTFFFPAQRMKISGEMKDRVWMPNNKFEQIV